MTHDLSTTAGKICGRWDAGQSRERLRADPLWGIYNIRGSGRAVRDLPVRCHDPRPVHDGGQDRRLPRAPRALVRPGRRGRPRACGRWDAGQSRERLRADPLWGIYNIRGSGRAVRSARRRSLDWPASHRPHAPAALADRPARRPSAPYACGIFPSAGSDQSSWPIEIFHGRAVRPVITPTSRSRRSLDWPASHRPHAPAALADRPARRPSAPYEL
jgi:hypothetical protein